MREQVICPDCKEPVHVTHDGRIEHHPVSLTAALSGPFQNDVGTNTGDDCPGTGKHAKPNTPPPTKDTI